MVTGPEVSEVIRNRINELNEDELAEALFLSEYMEGVMLIEGRKGSGKTTLAITLAYKLRELLARPVVLDFKPTKDFGPYTFLDEELFIENLSKVTKIARNTDQDDVELAVKWSLHKLGIELQGATVVLDEAYRYFDCRTPMDKLVRTFGYFIAQSRHYKNAVIILAPNRRYLDWRVKQQIDTTAKVAMNTITNVIHARLISHTTGESKRMRIYAPNYWGLFHSWSPIAMRKRLLDIRGLT